VVFDDEPRLGICARAARAVTRVPREQWASAPAFHESLEEVSARTIRRAARIRKLAPDLFEFVAMGAASITAAERTLSTRIGVRRLPFDSLDPSHAGVDSEEWRKVAAYKPNTEVSG
jgi:hypothetical protein